MPDSHSQTKFSAPTHSPVNGGADAQTASVADVKTGPNLLLGETLPAATGLLLMSLIGLVAISRRRTRHTEKPEAAKILPTNGPTTDYKPSVAVSSTD